jgi:hypothetical protein
MGFWQDFATGFQMPFEWGYNKLSRIDGVANNAINAAGNVVQAGGNLAGGLGDLLAGNSNILLYLGIGVVTIVVLPVLLDKLL